MTKTIGDSMNHTCLPKEVFLQDWERRDMQVTKGDRVWVFGDYIPLFYPKSSSP
jgi:hypothetical protein